MIIKVVEKVHASKVFYIYIYKHLKKLPTYEPMGCRIGNKC